jgi:hypothetical protein
MKHEQETPEEIEYNRCLQLKLCADAVRDRQPYSDVAEIFTDAEISEAEYSALLADPRGLPRFMAKKGYICVRQKVCFPQFRERAVLDR